MIKLIKDPTSSSQKVVDSVTDKEVADRWAK